MKNRILPLSLLIGAALTIPSLAMAAPAKPKPVTAKVATVNQTPKAETLENDVENTDDERVSTQSNAVEISETKTFSRSRASTNNQNPINAVATETLQNSQGEPEEEMSDPQEDMQNSQEDMQDPQEVM